MGLWGHCLRPISARSRGMCVCKGPTLWGSYAQIEDQSYMSTRYTYSRPSNGTMHVATPHVRVLCHVGRTIYIGNTDQPA